MDWPRQDFTKKSIREQLDIQFESSGSVIRTSVWDEAARIKYRNLFELEYIYIYPSWVIRAYVFTLKSTRLFSNTDSQITSGTQVWISAVIPYRVLFQCLQNASKFGTFFTRELPPVFH